MVAPVRDQGGSIVFVIQNMNSGNLSLFQLDRIFVDRSFSPDRELSNDPKII